MTIQRPCTDTADNYCDLKIQNMHRIDNMIVMPNKYHRGADLRGITKKQAMVSVGGGGGLSVLSGRVLCPWKTIRTPSDLGRREKGKDNPFPPSNRSHTHRPTFPVCSGYRRWALGLHCRFIFLVLIQDIWDRGKLCGRSLG